MALIDEETKNYLRDFFKDLGGEVKIYFFSNDQCKFCNEIREILNTFVETSNKIKVFENKEEERFKINEKPCIVLIGKEDYNIRYYGLPSGYEFRALIDTIMDISHGNNDLPPSLAKKLLEIDKEVRIRVFVTPTCPHCPRAVRSANKYAMINKNIIAEGIEAIEFEELSKKYNVMAVPKIVISINDKDMLEFEGAYPDAMFIDKILEAVEKSKK